jgi:hypothetical protein
LKGKGAASAFEFVAIRADRRCGTQDLTFMMIRADSFQKKTGLAAIALPKSEFILNNRRFVTVEVIDLVFPDKTFCPVRDIPTVCKRAARNSQANGKRDRGLLQSFLHVSTLRP